MSDKEVIQVGSKMFIFPRLPYETDKSYFARRKFVMRMRPDTQSHFLDSVRLSMVWANIQFLGCSYNSDVMALITKVIS